MSRKSLAAVCRRAAAVPRGQRRPLARAKVPPTRMSAKGHERYVEGPRSSGSNRGKQARSEKCDCGAQGSPQRHLYEEKLSSTEKEQEEQPERAGSRGRSYKGHQPNPISIITCLRERLCLRRNISNKTSSTTAVLFFYGITTSTIPLDNVPLKKLVGGHQVSPKRADYYGCCVI